jgi:2-dehydro-3-deoxyglucarate aldolase/4-hydroxy-2-oxoheptanedioate aldolase
VLIDMEHGNSAESSLLDQLRALKGSQTLAVVRVPAHQPDTIARYLDWGAHGIMVPHVHSAAEAESIVRAAYYPPRGKRGFSRSVRAYDYGLNPPDSTGSHPLIIAQIETGESVAASSEIARVDGIDVLFVGPADLQLDLKTRPETAPGSFKDCIQIVANSSASAGKAAGILLRDRADLPEHLALGFNCIALESDLSLLRQGFQQIIQSSIPSI